MKNTIILIAILVSSLSIMAQDITNSLGAGGKFTVSPPEIIDQIPTSTLNLFGSISYHFRDIHIDSFDFEQTDYMLYINQHSTGTLPPASASKGRLYMVFRELSSALTLVSRGGGIVGNNILDNPSSLYSYLYSDGTNWYVYELSSSGESGLNPGYVVNVERVDSETTSFEPTPDVQLYHIIGDSNLIVNLPSAIDVKGIIYTMTRIEGNGTGRSTTTFNTLIDGETLNGSSEDIAIQNVNFLYVYSDGINWWVFGYKTESSFYSQPVDLRDNTILNSDHLEQTFYANFDLVNHNYILTLPLAADNIGKKFTIKRNANGTTFTGNTINIKPSVGEQLDGIGSSSAYIMSNDYELLTVESNGVIWMIVNQVNH